MELSLAGVEATDELGRRLAGVLRPGDMVLLQGPLGAGKTALARAMLRTLTGDAGLDVPSPTFTLVQGYDTPLGLVQHFDLWRLDGAAAVRELGWDEGDVTLVEWPERLGEAWPAGALLVELSYDGQGRAVRLMGWEGRL